MMKLLLLSNSTMPGTPYLEWARPHIDAFLGDIRSILFIPYAAVGFSYDQYTGMLKKGLDGTGIEVRPIHETKNPVEVVRSAESIAVGGGNTFQLLKLIQEQRLVEPLREKVQSGTPYMGWSAGSNVAGPSIKTTNDMPIVQPVTFEALELFPFQINPHYTDKTLEGHGGESRKQRLREYSELNDTPVVCLPEGTGVQVENGNYRLIGSEPALVLTRDSEYVVGPGAFTM